MHVPDAKGAGSSIKGFRFKGECIARSGADLIMIAGNLLLCSEKHIEADIHTHHGHSFFDYGLSAVARSGRQVQNTLSLQRIQFFNHDRPPIKVLPERKEVIEKIVSVCNGIKFQWSAASLRKLINNA